MIIEELQKLHYNARPIEYKIVGGECWICTSHRVGEHGYPQIHRGKVTTVPRYVYSLLVGDIPEGLYVLHSCDNRLCINPAHLRVGTHLENIGDMVSRRRNVGSKLTKEDVIYIRHVSKEGLSRKVLAEYFGVHASTISDIVNEKIWRNYDILSV